MKQNHKEYTTKTLPGLQTLKCLQSPLYRKTCPSTLLDHKASLSKVKEVETIQNVFFDHSEA